MDGVTLLLTTAARQTVNAPNMAAAFERFAALACQDIDFAAFRDAVAVCERRGLIREPIRLPEGTLQCHWHLALTPQGVALARTLCAPRMDRPNTRNP